MTNPCSNVEIAFVSIATAVLVVMVDVGHQHKSGAQDIEAVVSKAQFSASVLAVMEIVLAYGTHLEFSIVLVHLCVPSALSRIPLK